MPRILIPTSPLFEGVIDFFFWEITETVEDLLALFAHPDYMRKGLKDFSSNITRQKEWLATRLLLKEALGDDVKISYTVSGRPFLIGSTQHISISHTRQYVLLALAQGPFGVDIEVWGSRALRLQQKFLSPDEASLLHSIEADKTAVRLWSAKESCYKYLDIPGLSLKNDIFLAQYDAQLEAHITSINNAVPIYYQDFPSFVLTWTSPE